MTLKTSDRIAQATVIKVFPHLGHGFIKGHVIAVWPQEGVDGTMWRAVRPDGLCDRLLTEEQAKESLRTCRRPDNTVIRWTELESKRIVNRHWMELTR